MPLKLKTVVIKPTLDCTANCPTCTLRQKLFTRRTVLETSTISNWEAIIIQIKDLGCKQIIISGGEPLLYSDLLNLIKTGVKYKIKIHLNSNGSLLNRHIANGLHSAGLSSVTFSIYSHNSRVHDNARNEPGLFDRALKGIKLIREQKDINVYLQTILTNYNIEHFDRLIDLAYHLRVKSVCVSYLEGDLDNSWLPTFTQIKYLRKILIPRIIASIRQQSNEKLRLRTIHQINNLFSDDHEKIIGFSNGEYAKTDKPYCNRPYNFAIILSNGDVLPCNGVEYNHSPIMGNLNKHSFRDLWYSSQWNTFRKKRHDWCDKCPMVLHFKIPITG